MPRSQSLSADRLNLAEVVGRFGCKYPQRRISAGEKADGVNWKQLSPAAAPRGRASRPQQKQRRRRGPGPDRQSWPGAGRGSSLLQGAGPRPAAANFLSITLPTTSKWDKVLVTWWELRNYLAKKITKNPD